MNRYKHAVFPRSYREATGSFARFDNSTSAGWKYYFGGALLGCGAALMAWWFV